MKIRSGYYCSYMEIDCKMLGKKGGFYLITNNPASVKYGFDSKNGYYEKSIEKKDKSITSAYMVRTKTKYKGFVFTISQNDDLKNNNMVRLFLDNLDFEAYDYFNLPYRDDEANIIVDVSELNEIWEEREPLSTFPFKIDKIKYLKNLPNL